MIKIMFVCSGNTCRSPMAEAIFTELIKRRGDMDLIEVDSAGFAVSIKGDGVSTGTKRVLKEKGIPCPERMSKRIRKEDYETYDLLIGMTAVHVLGMKELFGGDPDGKINSLLSFSKKGDRDIADPFVTMNYHKAYADICEGCLALYDYLKREKI